ncbi:uncharacterized protein EV420DRAFT_1527698 [Desarmillaria tabescens]|uniref:F-box domain-containing protein n=1 Tax=Armillaria tabescens TaxID=1929756 RepID=A0AA39T3I3_ARMTA|nr:uncharacterized protein EV420DRAFT_1527698 [Desarmillaria tabescens]KAK0461861.1 hypothetical protein EV420DRAFT_1527698 [Desarmillaria tabescens]
MSLQTFPQELINSIVNEIYDDHDALYACTLVNHAFLSAARFHFHSLINVEASHEVSSKLLELISISPGFCSAVKAVRLIFKSNESSGDHDAEELSLLPHVLRALSNLTAFSIRGCSRTIPSRLCQDLPLCPNIRSLSLTSLNFASPTDFLLLCIRFPGIQGIHLLNIGHFGAESGDPNDIGPRPRPEYLCLRRMKGDVLKYIDTSRLKKIRLTGAPGHQLHDIIQSTLINAAPKLEEVVINTEPHRTNALDLSRIPRITVQHFNYLREPFAGLKNLFFDKYPRELFAVKELTLKLYLFPERILSCEESQWAWLEDILLAVRDRVNIIVVVDHGDLDRYEADCVQKFSSAMPRLDNRGTLEVYMVEGISRSRDDAQILHCGSFFIPRKKIDVDAIGVRKRGET